MHKQCNLKDKINGFGNLEEVWISRITAHTQGKQEEGAM